MMSNNNKILHGDALTKLKELESESIDCIITSPPYWALRDYKVEGQLGIEKTIDEYVTNLIKVFDECKRVLKQDGTCWVVIGDTYSSSTSGNNNGSGKSGLTSAGKGKDILICDMERIKKKTGLQDKTLCMIPERFAIKMINNGWILRNKIIWHKRNCMPSSAKDRYTIDYEFIYFFTKNQKYYFKTQYEPITDTTISRNKYTRGGSKKCIQLNKDAELNLNVKSYHNFQNPVYIDSNLGRIKRCVWTINTKPFREAHFAVFPEELVKQCIDAGCPEEICIKCKKPKQIEEIKTGEFQRRWSTNNKEDSPYNKQSSMQNIYDCKVSSCNCNAGFESGIVLDPFMGSGTTALVALKNNRRFVGIELNQSYIDIALKRIEPYLYQSKLEIENETP